MRRSSTRCVEGAAVTTPQGDARHLELKVGGVERRPAARIITTSKLPDLAETVRIEWSALDRSPYKRVDALRSNRAVRVELDGVVLAEAQACVMVFETGLPTRYYVDATNVHFGFLRPSSTRSQCPYKGMTGGYWSAETNGKTVKDVAWTYLFTTPAMTPIAGLLAVLNENVDIFIDGELQARPTTHFS